MIRDYHLTPEHPPLVKLLSGLALNPKHPRLETYLCWGRLPVVLLSHVLALTV